MKYGIILHDYKEKTKNYIGYNIGDPIQSIALKNLYPQPVEYEKEKQLFRSVFSQQIEFTYNKYRYLIISEFYESRNKSKYGNYYTDKVKSIRDIKQERFDYIIWGCGLAGSIVYDLMKNEYPESKLIGVL